MQNYTIARAPADPAGPRAVTCSRSRSIVEFGKGQIGLCRSQADVDLGIFGSWLA
jgi:hypothetical protein